MSGQDASEWAGRRAWRSAAAVDEVYQRLDRLDMLVSNAGIGMRTVNPRFLTEPQPFWEVAPDGFRDVVETKLTGVFLVARAVVPRMLASPAAAGVHDERIVATEFEGAEWRLARTTSFGVQT